MTAVKTIVSGQHITDSNGNQIIGHPFKAKQFEGNQQGGNRAVGHTAEHTDHTAAGAESSRKTEDWTDYTAQSGTDKERRISPPLNPAPRVAAVKIIFIINAHGGTEPSKQRAIIGMPAPL